MADITLGAGNQDHVLERSGESDTITDFRSFYFVSTLDEGQEVPPNTDIPGIDGTGAGTLNFARTEFDFTLDINGINLAGGTEPDDMTDMHIHGGAPGVAGAIIFDFLNDAETEVDAAAGSVIGSWDSVEAVAQDMTSADVVALLDGNTYFNIHTNRDISGFIRGQILRDGGAVDRIDLTELNIGSFDTIRAIATAGADTTIRTFFDGELTALTLEGISRGALDPDHFIFAGEEDEEIDGTINRDTLFGAGGDDTLSAFRGNDRLFGEDGDDALLAAPGRDSLLGGLGLDELTGGAHADRFVFRDVAESGNTSATADQITDFVTGSDDIVLSVIDADTATAGNQAFTLIDADAFDAAGQARVTDTVDGDTLVFLNTTGTRGAEMAIRLAGDLDLSDVDFLL